MIEPTEMWAVVKPETKEILSMTKKREHAEHRVKLFAKCDVPGLEVIRVIVVQAGSFYG